MRPPVVDCFFGLFTIALATIVEASSGLIDGIER